MRTDMIRSLSWPLQILVFSCLSVLSSSVLGASCFPDAGSVSIGGTGTSADDFSDPRWLIGGTLECFGDRLLQPRVLIGLATLKGNGNLQGAGAGYVFSTGGISFGNGLVSATLGAGVYVTHIEAPIVPDSSYDFEYGYNGGIRFLLPMGHDAGIPFELLYHRISGPGPDDLWTFTVGVFGW